MNHLKTHRVVAASEFYGGLGIFTNFQGFTDLVTPEVAERRGRGVHISCYGAIEVCPVFLRGGGWIDVDYQLALEAQKEFNVQCGLNPRPNDYTCKSDGIQLNMMPPISLNEELPQAFTAAQISEFWNMKARIQTSG